MANHGRNGRNGSANGKILGCRIGYGYDNFEIPKIRILYPQNILLQKKDSIICFLKIFGYRIGYTYPLGCILPVPRRV
jgi:hypothetical protein